MDVALALDIEAAEREYLSSRVENLTRLDGNPYGASVFFNANVPCFHVKATPSPMFNRIYADITGDSQTLLNLLKQSAHYRPVTPLIAKPSELAPSTQIAGRRLERLKGWTHLQLACAIDSATVNHHPFEIEEVTPQTLAQFARIHAGGFHTKPQQRLLNQASFAGFASSERAKIYVLNVDGDVVAGALMFLASNGIAYLGTAATRKDARGLGYHAALITHRIKQAKKHGSRMIAATALANSQSRRNLQRAGLTVSHAQGLYRLADN